MPPPPPVAVSVSRESPRGTLHLTFQHHWEAELLALLDSVIFALDQAFSAWDDGHACFLGEITGDLK